MHASTNYIMQAVGGLEEELHRSTDDIMQRKGCGSWRKTLAGSRKSPMYSIEGSTRLGCI